MGEEESLPAVPFDRSIEQAILVIKKGAHLLKCRRRGKPKVCPFRLSTDEKFLIWYSGQEEKQLRLSSVTNIVTGQRSFNFQRQLQPDKELQSFSLIFGNGERSLDLICKDKLQADSWFVGLRAVISRCYRTRQFLALKSHRGAQSCISSPAGYIRRKHNLGLLEDVSEFPQVYSLWGSPSQSLSERCFSDGVSFSSYSFYSSESSLSQTQNAKDVMTANSPCTEPDNLEKCQSDFVGVDSQKNSSHRFVGPVYRNPLIRRTDILKDILIWGEGVGGSLGGVVDRSANINGMQPDALFPKLLESTMMLDVRNISLGGKHAALVTKLGEVFCWGEGSRGRLGHKVIMDVSYPKLVESLNGVLVQSVACGEFQTCALTQSGELYTWGDTHHGADLMGDVTYRSQWFPRKLSGPLDGISVLNVACGEWHTAIVSTSGQLFTYGDGSFGVLGHGNLKSVTQPKEVESLKGLWVKSVSCGPWHTAAIVEIVADRYKFNAIGGKLFTWGDGDNGRLGHGDGETKLLPTCVAQLVDYDFVQVSCGRMLTVALSSLGKVCTMGSAVHGQLGNPQARDKSITLVEGKLKEEFVKEISTGSYHVAVLTSSGGVYTWGRGANGQLGLGDIQDRNSPTFVEAMRDRQVESIACGSSITAAICLHKSISSSDQSACSGCRTPFGFTRKKHNCYNCGLQFCSACSSKKIANASLAPNKSKPSRVCDPCFKHLLKTTESGRLLKLENCSSRLLLTPRKEDRGEVTPRRGQLLSTEQCYSLESQAGEGKTSKNKGEKQQQLEPVSLPAVLPRWGQVSCPAIFQMHCNKDFTATIPVSNNQLSSVPLPSVQKIPLTSKFAIFDASIVDKGLSESRNKKLIEEVQKLRVKARSLEKICQAGNQKIEECKKQIEEAWSLAREEAAKSKATKEIIKVLALKLRTMSEKVSTEREARDGFDANSSQITPKCSEHSTVETESPVSSANHPFPQVKLPKGRRVDSLSNSPIVFSNTLKSVYGRKESHDKNRLMEEDTETESKQNGMEAFNPESWVEQYEPGVYITLANLPSGDKLLKRVRFSRRRFTEAEAGRWWKENELLVYMSYGVEGYMHSNQSTT
ncbi:RCC1 domain-containing protein/FYVE domain-containing protein/BRX domain-containing protein/BRX_N domain-containing protein [Cephalotus follicularis]|uniref:RCC1 domain-containing protein/FYVE domain-containing protein/BRX domain-containing protein/BRX_N domain-containing protein n=1 Tax=Cephalotus follicularis TaxID=3775 RepID=A0A1Q3B179_CEPFO|nr:RCC1 domain-containing protein/FYVE domain-containing protein/BRX domain-containing protein/BRX_N domain-containing protein [Cephalotus follicularis]